MLKRSILVCGRCPIVKEDTLRTAGNVLLEQMDAGTRGPVVINKPEVPINRKTLWVPSNTKSN